METPYEFHLRGSLSKWSDTTDNFYVELA